MVPWSDAQVAMAWSARLCCVGLFWQAAEIVAVWPELRDRHLLAWQAGGPAPGWWRRRLQRAQGFPTNLAIMGARALAALGCIFLPVGESHVAWIALLGLLVTQLYFIRVFPTIFANSDHVNLFCLAALAVAAWPEGSAALRLAAAGFISFQACLGYVASGLDKLFAPNWRSGARLTAIFQDSSHQVPTLGRWLAGRPWRGAVVSWAVILLEVLFPLCLVLSPTGFWFFIAAGLLFHFSIGVLMALPGFFWAFASTYPAMYIIHGWIEAGGRG